MDKRWQPRIKLWVYYSNDFGYWRAEISKEDRAKEFQQTEKHLPYISWDEHTHLIAAKDAEIAELKQRWRLLSV